MSGVNEYTYNAEDVRIRNLCGSDETIYTYNTNCKLSQLLMKTTNGIVTKYVYGLGLIGEEKQGCFKTYHFDYRGSTVAITNESGCITDTFEYDTYGKLIFRTGSTFVIFGYNGRDGVVTDRNGLIYMRARYYSPEHRRFVNADIVKGEITNAITLNRYAYANGNPVSNVDPFGLVVDERGSNYKNQSSQTLTIDLQKFLDEYFVGKTTTEVFLDDNMREALLEALKHAIRTEPRPNNIAPGTWAKQVQKDLQWADDILGPSSKFAKGLKVVPFVSAIVDTGTGIYENYQNGVDEQRIMSDSVVDLGFSVTGTILSTAVAGFTTGFLVGSVAPGVGNLIGALVGLGTSIGFYFVTEVSEYKDKSMVEWAKEGLDWVYDKLF